LGGRKFEGEPMKIISILAGIFLVLSTFAEADAQSSSVQGISLKLLDYGLVNISALKTTAPSTPAPGQHDISDNAEFYKRTTAIPAKKQLTFGIKYQVNGTPEGKNVLLTYRVLHPQIKGTTTSTANVIGTIGAARADYYTFEEDYELAEGEWKMQIWVGTSMLLEKRFVVRK
jgi:hypothetical protein